MPPTQKIDPELRPQLKEQPQPWDDGVKISKDEYELFQKFVKYISNQKSDIMNQQMNLSQTNSEGFANVNDDFNDVLLFGLLGFFFLMIIDYVYKLGRKSY